MFSLCHSVCCSVCCSVLQSGAVSCSVLQCVAVCCSVLQCVAVCCSVLQCNYWLVWEAFVNYALQCVAVFSLCSCVLQFAVV